MRLRGSLLLEALVGVYFGLLRNEYVVLYRVIQYCCHIYLDDGLGV